MLATLTTLYWTWYWNPGLVILGFFANALPLGGLCAFYAMVHDMVTYTKPESVEEDTEKVDLEVESA